MTCRTPALALACCLAAGPAAAQEVGTASGKGTIERIGPAQDPSSGEPTSEQVGFSPRYAFAYDEGAGATASHWVVLTEKEPPLSSWASDRAEARRLWCEKEKTPFVAVKLDAEWKVDLYFLCPANGGVNTEMPSSWNGLDSVVVTFESRDGKRLKGTLRTGRGSCPDADGAQRYCTPTGDYAFDAPLLR